MQTKRGWFVGLAWRREFKANRIRRSRYLPRLVSCRLRPTFPSLRSSAVAPHTPPLPTLPHRLSDLQGSAAEAPAMAAPVVDAEYLRQVDRARRHLRALISNKGCAPIMLRLAYVRQSLTSSRARILAPSYCLVLSARPGGLWLASGFVGC